MSNEPQPTNTQNQQDDKQGYSVEVMADNTKVYRFYTIFERSIYCDSPWYKPLILELNKKHNPNDVIEIHLDSIGGSIACTDTLITAIDRCDCKVRLFVSGICASAATLITFIPKNYESITISDRCIFLFHSARSFTFGKIQDMKDNIENLSDIQDIFFDEAYKDILTDKEIKKIKEGKELYLTGKEVNIRYNARCYKESKRKSK